MAQYGSGPWAGAQLSWQHAELPTNGPEFEFRTGPILDSMFQKMYQSFPEYYNHVHFLPWKYSSIYHFFFMELHTKLKIINTDGIFNAEVLHMPINQSINE
jgi:hypothetical protein